MDAKEDKISNELYCCSMKVANRGMLSTYTTEYLLNVTANYIHEEAVL